MTDFKYKPDGLVLKEYMKCDDFWRGIRGPVGSGKSVASAVEVFRRGLEQQPNDKGIRRSRWAVIRNTGPQLKTTTIKTWLDWFPEDVYGPFRWGVPFTHHIMVGDVDMEVIFLALDSEDDIRKLLSLELTGIWANEAREMPKAIIDACTMRVGRFPSMREGGPSWYGMIADTNAPEDDHWWAIMSGDAPLPEFITEQEALMLRRPEGWKFFNQPPALLEEKDSEGTITGYISNPDAENANNLTPEYYHKIITGKTKDWIDVYVMNRLGTVSEGRVVYPNYNDEIHKAKDTLNVMPGKTIFVGLDFGFFPAAIFGQRSGHGQWHIIREVVPEDMSLPEFARVIKATLGELLVTEHQQFKIYGDPSGSIRSSAREDKKSPFQILRANGVEAYPAPLPSNDPTIRIETVKSVLDRMVDGEPGILISPECSYLVKGFRAGYCYRRVNTAGTPRYENSPVKNKYSHPHDGLQYLLLGAGEGRALTQSRSNNAQKGKAKTKWSVFGKKKRRGKTSRRTTI
jgi:hypothetical protein